MQLMFQVTGPPLGNGDPDTAGIAAIVVGFTEHRLGEIKERLARMKQIQSNQDRKLVEMTFDDPVLLFGHDIIEAEENITGEDVWDEDSDWVEISDHLPDVCEYIPSAGTRLRITLSSSGRQREICWLAYRKDCDPEIETRPTTFENLQTAYEIYRAEHQS